MSQTTPEDSRLSAALRPKISELYPWQKQVVEICNTAPTTTCHWYWGPVIGKTALAHFLADHYGAYVVRDQSTASIRKVLQRPDCKVLVVHPCYGSKTVPYGAITNAMDGCLMNLRGTGPQFRNAPHVFVLSNHPPNRAKLSEWKWHVQHISTTQQEPDPLVPQIRAAHQPTLE